MGDADHRCVKTDVTARRMRARDACVAAVAEGVRSHCVHATTCVSAVVTVDGAADAVMRMPAVYVAAWRMDVEIVMARTDGRELAVAMPLWTFPATA